MISQRGISSAPISAVVPPPPSGVTTPPLGTEFPDFGTGAAPARPGLGAALTLAFAGVFALPQLPLPAPLCWGPRYLDQIDARPGLHASRQQAVAFPQLTSWVTTPSVPALSWGPEFPDFASGLRSPRESFQFVAYAPAIGQWAVPKLGWSPEFPDFASGPRAAREAYPFIAYQPAMGQWPVPKLGWAPAFPDFALGPQPLVAQRPFAAYSPAIGKWPVPALAWKANFPDFASGLRLPAALNPFAAYTPAIGQWALPSPLCWQGTFPALVWGRTFPTALQLHSVLPQMTSWAGAPPPPPRTLFYRGYTAPYFYGQI